MPYRIIKANDSQLRRQITDALNDLESQLGGGVSDDAYGAGWNGVTDTAPSQNAVYDKIESVVATIPTDAVLESDYNANTILAANADNTPLPVTIDEDRIVVRLAGGNIKGATPAEIRTLLNVEDGADVTDATNVAASGAVMESDYRPAMMQFDGVSSYYSATGFTTSGNILTVVFRFVANPSLGAGVHDFFMMQGPTNLIRVLGQIAGSSHAATDRQDRVAVQVRNSSDVAIGWLFAERDQFLDGLPHTVFFTFNATAGTAQWVVDGVQIDDLTNSERVAPTTGTLAAGAASELGVGATDAGLFPIKAQIGYFGYRDAGGLDWTDFMFPDGSPKPLDESGWSEWGAQPLFWNPHGELTNNLGSAGNMTETGTVRMSLPGFAFAEKPIATQVIDEDSFASNSAKRVPTQQSVKAYVDSRVTSNTFTPEIWDDSLSGAESQTYTARSGVYRKHGDMVFFWIDITVNSLGTLTTSQRARIGALPFVSLTSGGILTAVSVGYADSLAITAGTSVSATIPVNSSHIDLWLGDVATGISSLLLSELSTGGRLAVSGIYISA